MVFFSFYMWSMGMGTRFCLSPGNSPYLWTCPQACVHAGGIKGESPALGNEFSSLPGC